MKKNVHIVPHTHWDREWDFTLSRSKIYLMKDFEDILETLDSDKEFCHFMLDGQSSLLEDYLRWRPEEEERIKRLIINKKLSVGPWYTQTDQFLASGESIVRNLMYGIMYANSLGGSMNVAYVPDTFGQAGNIPQIYHELKIDRVMLWRGISADKIYNSEFIWEGYDGTEIKAYQISEGYFVGGLIDEGHLDHFTKDETFKRIVDRSTTSQIYYPNGFDQAPIRKNLPEIIKKLNELHEEYHFEISNVEKYTDAVNLEVHDLQKAKGEFTIGKNMRVHKSIYSSRADIKILNTQIQNRIVNHLEPLASLGSTLGITYPYGQLEEIWKLLFENSSHDSLGSCTNDQVNLEIKNRYLKIKELVDTSIEIIMREITERIGKNKLEELPLIIFNTLPYIQARYFEFDLYVPFESIQLLDAQRKINVEIHSIENKTDYITSQIIRLDPSKEIYIPEPIYRIKGKAYIEDIPAYGFKKLLIIESKDEEEKVQSSDSFVIENPFYKIVLNDTGSLDILNKQNNIWYLNQAILEENGDDGDAFNYSPPLNDLVLSSLKQERIVKIEKNKLSSSIQIEYKFQVPKDLSERVKKKCTTDFSVLMNVCLNDKDSSIRFNVDVDNTKPLSHRLCILFDSQFFNNESIADTQFGTIKRPVYLKEEMESFQKDPSQWNEMPIAIETCQSFVALSNNDQCMAVVPKSVREYEIVGEQFNKIRLTLFRTFGFMGKENLVYRPGRASGDKTIQTPDAQLLDHMNFEFSLILEACSFEDAKIPQKAKEINTDILYYQKADYLDGRLRYRLGDFVSNLPNEYSLIEATGNLVISTIKKAENRRGYIMRLYNASLEENINEKILFKKEIKKISLVNLLEEQKIEMNLIEDTLILENIKPSKFISIYFEFKGE